MIWKALRLLTDELRRHIAATDTVQEAVDAPQYVVPGNIALADVPDLSPTIRQRTVLSVVNIHEEAAFKNGIPYERTDRGLRYRNAPVHLNLFLLFSANYDSYENALIRLSQVIAFFQGKNVFTFAGAPVPELLDDPDLADVKLILDLYALTFEQINHLWGSLGGKQVPFVLYKLRLVRIQADRTHGEGGLVEEIQSNEQVL